jgi:hypothetical protein
MHFRKAFLLLFLLITGLNSFSRETDSLYKDRSQIFSGFVRGGFYGDVKDNGGKPFFSSGFADLGLKADYDPGSLFRAYADVRLRYGSEFHEPVSYTNLREAFVEFTGKKLSFSAGKRIIKWGRADFTNPTSKLNPQNYISRSPDREDMDLGNILAEINWFPTSAINLQAVVTPFYSPSVLIIDPIPLPEYVSIQQLPSLVTDQAMMGYGLKADLHLRGIDMGFSWFDGYDPMPGTALTSFTADFSGTVPVLSASLNMKPYAIKVAGFDFESSVGSVGFRGEAAWSKPDLSFSENEYVPLPEIKWVAGIDASFGEVRVTGEYEGKYVLEYTPSPVDPILGTEPDYSKLFELIMTPGFDLQEYMRQQVGAFNRLYNYQLEKFYHSAGLRIETELFYGKVTPVLFTMYNFTSHDFMVMPEIRVKPADGISFTLGAELYYGKKGSLYDIVDGFMSSIYVGLRADF